MTAMTAAAWQSQGVLVADAAYKAPRTNPMAIAAMWTAVAGWTLLPGLGAIGAIVLGAIALSGCRKRGEAGSSLALWALVLGVAGVVIGIVVIVMLSVGVFAAFTSAFAQVQP